MKKIIPGSAGGTTIVIISSERIMTLLRSEPRIIIIAIEYPKPMVAMPARNPTNFKRSFVNSKSTGLGYIIERTS